MCAVSSGASPSEAGAPEIEATEVTPEMIAAGVEELSSFNPDFDRAEAVVERIYCEMAKAKRLPRTPDN